MEGMLALEKEQQEFAQMMKEKEQQEMDEISKVNGTPPGSRDPRRLDALHRCGSDLAAQPLASGSSGWSL